MPNALRTVCLVALAGCSSTVLGPSATTDEGFFFSGPTRLSYALDTKAETHPEVGGNGKGGDVLFSNDGPTEAEVDLGTHHQSVVPIQQIDDLEIQLPLTLTTPGSVRKASIDAGPR